MCCEISATRCVSIDDRRLDPAERVNIDIPVYLAGGASLASFRALRPVARSTRTMSMRALVSSSAPTSDDAEKPPKRNETGRSFGSPLLSLLEENQAALGEGYMPDVRGISRRDFPAKVARANRRHRCLSGGRSNSSQSEAIPRKPETNFKRIASRSRPRSVVASSKTFEEGGPKLRDRSRKERSP